MSFARRKWLDEEKSRHPKTCRQQTKTCGSVSRASFNQGNQHNLANVGGTLESNAFGTAKGRCWTLGAVKINHHLQQYSIKVIAALGAVGKRHDAH